MFTGIVANKYPVKILSRSAEFMKIAVLTESSFIQGLKIGDSVAVNGVCLTVTAFNSESIEFDLMQETINITTFGNIDTAVPVNVERSLKFGDEIGGHILSGHVDTTAMVEEINSTADNFSIDFKIAEEFSKFLFTKGYIAVNGVSLTLNRTSPGIFGVNLIPETVKRTNIGNLKKGQKVNIEFDRNTHAIVLAVENYFKNKPDISQ